MSEVRGSNSWRDELASLVSDSGIRYAAADPIEVPPASFDAQASDFGPGELEQSESFKDQIKGFAIAWGEILVDLGRGCKDIVEQNILTEDSYIVRKLRKPCAKASAKLRYVNEFLPEDRDPAHAWPVIFFVSILALTAMNFSTEHDSLVRSVKKVQIHPPSASHVLLPDGRRLAYHEQGVPAERTRFLLIAPHSFLSSRLAGIPGIKISLLEEFGIRLVTYDLPGFGESDPHPGRDLNSSALDMLYLANGIGFDDKFWVLGHSSGAMHAWASLRYIPDRVAAMVTFTKKSMVERCLIAASLAALVCHPSSTVKCFKPKPRPRSPQKQKPEDPSASPPKGSKRHGVVIGKEVPSKPKEKPCPKAASSSSSTSKSRKSTKTKAEKPINLISELVGGDPSIGVVESIIRSGWVGEVGLRIEKVLRVHHSLDVLHGFEEYRKTVKSKYEKDRIRKRVERLVVDGNELLQFHGAAITCSLGINGFSTICKKKCCQVCRIIASGFDTGDGTISFVHDSWKAHEKAAKECSGKGESARKAIVVCRVIAGRIAHYHAHGLMDEEEGEFDSAMEWGEQFSKPKRLVVLNSEAVLPCFVIIYNVKNKNLLHD